MITLNGSKIDPTVFPDGTSQVWKLAPHLIKSINRVRWSFEDERELVWVVQLGLLLKHSSFNNLLILECPYLPYGRQDKDIRNDSCFALHAFCKSISGIYDWLDTFDCHNPEFFGEFKGFEFFVQNTMPFVEMGLAAESCGSNLFCFPDHGAHARYQEIIDADTTPIVFRKDRDPSTGEIVGMVVDMGSVEKKDIVLIVDDICDGGRTFIEVAKVLTAVTPEVHLYVSHGIFSKGLGVLRDAGIKRIFTMYGELM